MTVGQRGAGTILFGGSGFLGSHILRLCPGMVSVGRSVPPVANRHVVVPSLRDLDSLADVAFDKVVFLVGHSDHYRMERERIDRDRPDAFEYHLVPLLETLEQLKHRPIRKFVHFSTILLYDETRLTLPVDERAPIDPYKNRYVLSKYLAEEASKFYARWMPILTVRLSNVYGPWPRERYDIIHLLIRQLLDEGSAVVWSTRPERDFIHVEDAAEAVAQLLETDHAGTVNLGTGRMTSVARVVELLREMSGCPITVKDEPVQGPLRFQCDMTTLHRLLPWRPRWSVEEGVRHTWDQMLALPRP